ncbi:MAG: class I SAM-dependent methyltransferase [Cyclobacteriaceae bacterium]|nr:class I SAM-dependent methyltransferase [Cyclobacteriaceae bacterium]
MHTPPLNRFDCIAPFYDRLSTLVFGSSIINAQKCNLHIVPAHAEVLVLGGGTGKWLIELLKHNEMCKIWYVEASLKMIQIAKEHLKATDQVVFIHGTQENIPNRKFDIIITHFFVDMFGESDLLQVAEQMASVLNAGGKWIVADFVNNTHWHKLVLWLMYGFFNIVGALDRKALPDWDRIIQSKSFAVENETCFYSGFIKNIVYAH